LLESLKPCALFFHQIQRPLIVRVVVGQGDTIVSERWSAKDGGWLPGGDPALPAFGRRLSDEEIAARPKSSSR